MKRTVLTLLLVLSAFCLQAQTISAADSAVLKKIFNTNKQYRSMQASFRHDRIEKGAVEHKYGTYYAESIKNAGKDQVGAKIAMRYSKPANEYYVITATHLFNGINGHQLKFNYTYVPLMKQLGKAMAWAIQGDVLSLYATFNVNFQLSADATHYTVTLTSKNGFNKGISKLVLKYQKSDCVISYLEIEEKLGTTHKYTMGIDAKGSKTHPLINTPIDQSVYVVK